MATNNDAAFRHREIDKCLRNTMRKWTKLQLLDCINEALAEKYAFDPKRRGMGIKERQLNYDINDMKTLYGAPIEQRRNGKQYFYYYEEPDFSIMNLPLEEKDLSYLREAVELIRQIKGFPISDDLDTIVSRLENKIKTATQGSKPIIAFENPPMALGTELLSDLYESILQKTVLQIDYQPFKAPEPQTQIIHPYFLKEYNNRWFLFGWNEDKERIDNLALDRMQKMKNAKSIYKYRENTLFDADVYFSDIVGVTRATNALPEKIEIKVAAERAPYLRSKPLHHSQEILHTYKDGSLRIGYQLIVNFELISLLLSFGPQIEVVKPMTLREKLITAFQQGLALYE